MYRAKGVFGDYISCGLFFAGVIALCLAIRPYQIFLIGKPDCIALIFIGVFATISSAPLFALIISVSFIFLYRQRQYLPLVIFCSLIWLLFLEVTVIAILRSLYPAFLQFRDLLLPCWID